MACISFKFFKFCEFFLVLNKYLYIQLCVSNFVLFSSQIPLFPMIYISHTLNLWPEISSYFLLILEYKLHESRNCISFVHCSISKSIQGLKYKRYSINIYEMNTGHCLNSVLPSWSSLMSYLFLFSRLALPNLLY